MFISADQLLAHAIGDYILQSHWMATEKTKKSLAALCHVLTYSIPFVVLFRRASWLALFVIVGTHFVIDRWRLARVVVWLKNFLAPARTTVLVEGFINESKTIEWSPRWAKCRATGYSPETPIWLSVWLLIIADNIMHVIINGLALKYL